jgi:acyl-CoA synthetase (AMP-forming)/AMP-acid ligase II
VDGSSVALLQYTSGSTGNPKGVAILQQNLLANLAYIERAFGLPPGSRGVTWLPPYHDMGLIGCILQPIYGSWQILAIDTLKFIQRPHLWLDAISSFRATHSGGPSFAFQLCCDRIPPERRAELDLSSWEVAFNGAEPVRAAVMDRFTKMFSPAGFHARSFLPCYGLAEATLMVTCARRGVEPGLLHVDRRRLASGEVVMTAESDPAAVALVSCGTADAATRITIVDPETGAPSPSGHVGEIVYQGASRSAGYWGQPRVDVTAPLHTGDLGFIHDGETYVVGRLKDTVIHNGRKFHAEDLEQAVAHAHPALASALSTAFAVDDGERSKLIVLLEYRSALRAAITSGPLVELVRATLAESHGLQVDAVELIARLPRTTSGKVQRGRARQLYLSNELAVRDTP